MWNKLTQAAALVTGETEEETEEDHNADLEEKEKLQHQELLIQQLKDLVRENEKRFQEKNKDYEDLSTKFDKFKLQSKAKITQLSKQIKDQEREKTPKKEDCDFDDASSTDSSDRSQRGKVILLRKQLDQAKQQLEKKEEESKRMIGIYEKKINDMELQLTEKNTLISSLVELKNDPKEIEKAVDSSPKKETNAQEMYAQIVYKDSKILDLNNQIMELEKKIMDLQENIKEKDEVLQQRNRAVQLMAEDLNRKGQTTVIELDETRDQMKIMQQNFATIESDWKSQLEKYERRVTELENEIKEWDLKLKNSETSMKNIECARYQLSVKNAELQKKIVDIQSSASKQCEQFNKEIQGEIETLKKNLELEKQHCADLQKALDESSNESKSKVFKARVEERSKAKKLERELNEIKKSNKEKPEEVLILQQKVAELEEEKGSLQLKLIEIEDQIAQIEKLKNDNASLQKSAEETLDKVQCLEKQICEHQLENTNWKSKFEDWCKDYAELKEKLDILSKEHFEAQEAYTFLLEEKKKFEDDYNELKNNYDHIEREYKEMVQNLQCIKEEKVTFGLKNIELEEMRDKDEEAKKKLISRVNELEELLNDESRPYIQLEKENANLKQRLQTLIHSQKEIENKDKLQIESLERTLLENKTESSSEVEKLMKTISELKSTEKELMDKILKLEDREKEFIENKSEFSIEVEKLSNKISDLESRERKLIENNGEMSVEISKLNNKTLELEHSCSELQQNLTKKISENEELRNKLLDTEHDISDIFNLFGVSHMKELADFKKENEANVAVKENFIASLQEKDEAIQKYSLNVDNLYCNLEKAKSELLSRESIVNQLKNTILDKDDLIQKLTSDLDCKIICEENLNTLLSEKEQLILKYIEDQLVLKEKLEQSNSMLNNEQTKIKDKMQTFLDQISDFEKEITNLREELSHKTVFAENVNSELHSLHSTHQLLLKNFEEKERILTERENVIQELKLYLENEQLEVKKLNDKIMNLDNLVKAKDEDLLNVGNEVIEKDGIIEMKNKCLNELEEKAAKYELSFLDKDKLHEEMLSCKLNLESEISSIKKEKECLANSFENKSKELKALKSEFSEIKSMLQEQQHQNADLVLNLSNAEKEICDLKLSLQSKISEVGEKESFCKNVVEEKYHLQKEMSSSINKFQEDLNAATLSIESYKKQCEELKKQICMMNDEKIEFNDTISNLQEQIQNLTDENKLLLKEIASLKEKYSSEITSLNEQMLTHIKNAEFKIECIESEKLKLLELVESFQISLNNSDSQIKTRDTEICILKEEKITLENNVAEFVEKIKILESKVMCLENELATKEKLSGEKSEIEVTLQNTLLENKKLTQSISELQIKINQYINEKQDVANLNSNLKTLVSEKESYTVQLKSELNTEKEKVVNLQDALNQRNSENEANQTAYETKLSYFLACKQHLYILLNSLMAALEIRSDISFLESEHFNDLSIDDFTKFSKNVVNITIENLLKVQDNANYLKDELSMQKTENNVLYNNCSCLKECLSNVTSTLLNDTDKYNSKFTAILSALQEKENNLSQMLSNLELIKSKCASSNDLVSEIIQNMYKLVDKVKNQITNTYNMLNCNFDELYNYEDQLHQLENLMKSTNTDYCYSIVIDLCNTMINQYCETVHELTELLVTKNATIEKLTEENKNNELCLANLQSELQNQQISYSANTDSFKQEIKRLNCLLNESSSQNNSLEHANMKIQELQNEVDNFNFKLKASEEKNNLLLQEIEQSNYRAQLANDEKFKLLSCVEQMQLEMREMHKKNSDLQFHLREKENLIIAQEKDVRDIKDYCSEYTLKNQNMSKELECLKREKDNLIHSIALVEKNHSALKEAVEKLKNSVISAVQEEYDLKLSLPNIEDKIVSTILHDLYNIYKKNFEENKSLSNQIKALESKYQKISEECEETKKIKTDTKIEMIEVSRESKKETQVLSLTADEPEQLKSVPQQDSSLFSEELVKSLELSNSSLKEELNEYKKKFAKVLSKLKVFKDEKEKLSKDLKELQLLKSELEKSSAEHLENVNILQEKIISHEKENKILSTKLKSMNSLDEQKTETILGLNNNNLNLKERYSNLEEQFFKVQHELQEYKQTWEQTNVSYELLKEDNEHLKLKIKILLEQVENSKSKTNEVTLQLNELLRENSHLKQEAENLREHAEMLISDNDTFQDCIEKLTAAKNSSEQKFLELKKKFDTEIKDLQIKHESELKKIDSNQSTTTETVMHAEKLEKECTSLKTLCTNLQLSVEKLQRECDTYVRNQNLLEKEKTYLQHQLLEKTEELQKMNKLLKNSSKSVTESPIDSSDTNISSTIETDSSCNEISSLKINKLKEENNHIQKQLNALIEELNYVKEMNTYLQQENSSKETLFNERIYQLETQLRQFKSLTNQPSNSQSNSEQLEKEFQQAMSNLHSQGLRCEELSLEVSKLLEERNILKWKLQQYIQLNPGVTIEQENFNTSLPLDHVSVKVETSSNDTEIAALHDRLIESERTCQELRKANDALDRALVNERYQKKIIEEELDLAKEHITEETRPTDEYHILLGDVNDSEMFTETNFSISRNVQTHTYKLRRWLKGRRNYLCRALKSRNYPQLIYLFYICFVHIWLLSCVFS